MPTTQIETTPQWANYLDLALDVKPWLQIDPTSPTNDAKLQDLVDMGCWWVQDYLGRPVAPTQFFRRFSGLTTAYIDLPYYPVLSVASVVEYWGSSGPHTLTEQTPANQGAQDCFQMDYLRGTLIRTFMGLVARPFFPGMRNIEVTWTAGYDPVPPPIKTATKELIAHWYRNTQEAPRWFGRGDQYDAPQGAPLWPAIPDRVTMLLQPFMQVGIA